jgi:hypothetical protein
MRLQHKLGPLKVLNNHLLTYPTPMNLSYAYNFGSLAGIVLASQIITGILLAMHYVGHVDLAFNSVIHLMNDVPSGMILRYAHANGASLFFIVVYIHILRGVYYSSGNQPREAVWITGVVILLVMVLTAFIGYNYGQKWILNNAIILYKFFYINLESLNKHFIEFLNSYDYISLTSSIIQYNQVVSEPTTVTLLSYSVSLPPNGFNVPLTITLNTKGHIKKNITPIKSYFNLHLIETQLKIKKDNQQKAGIYIVVNNINGNFYIGSAITNRINTHFRNHCVLLNNSNKPLLRALRKYGIQNFSFHIVEYFNGFVNKENLQLNHLKLLERESFFITSYKPIYNILLIVQADSRVSSPRSVPVDLVPAPWRVRGQQGNEPATTWPGGVPKGSFPRPRQGAGTRSAQGDKGALFKAKHVILSNIKEDIISEYTSIQQVSEVFSCNRKTVRKYINSDKMFKQLGYLKTRPQNGR